MNTLADRIQNKIDHAQGKLTAWAEQLPLSPDPHYEMGWSLSMFNTTADIRVGRSLLALLNDGVSLDDLITDQVDRILRAGRYPAQSTSPTSNLAEQAETAARAEYLDMLKWTAKKGE